jgi:hypothetical protein
MIDKPRTRPQAISKSGLLLRSVLEPESRQDVSPPSKLPEQPDDGATTGIMPVVSEGEDRSAQRDSDSAQRDGDSASGSRSPQPKER